MNKVNNWIDIIQQTLFPPTCILCNNSGFNGQDICQNCLDDLPRNLNCCLRCAESFESQEQAQYCGRCLSSPPAFDHTVAPYGYDDRLRYLISGLKFNRHHPNARLLGFLLAHNLKPSPNPPEAIIPMPIHPTRLKERGFDQTFEIAKAVTHHLKIPINPDLALRIRNTPHQIHLSAQQRRINLKSAFQITAPKRYRHVAILDDVMTTGTTCHELAQALKKSGVKKVEVWVCARA
jgi:ComF family protein